MSSKSIKAFETHLDSVGRLPKEVDITGCAPKAKRRESFTAKGIRWPHQESIAMPISYCARCQDNGGKRCGICSAARYG